jgi:hypothetical protein
VKPSYSYYGSREVDAARLSVLLAEATGLKFMPRHSFYIGDYYSAGRPGGDSIGVRPNEFEDEDGKFLQWKEFVGYQTIVEIEEASEGFFEELRPKLAEVEGLEYLKSVK